MEQQILDGMYEQLGISKEVLDYAADIEESLKERFEGIDQVAEYKRYPFCRNYRLWIQ